MGLFSRKKPQQPLPPMPRYAAQSGPSLPSYEPEFPEVHSESMIIPPPPQAPSFPRPQVEDKTQPEFTRFMDDRLPSRQEPLVRPVPVAMPHPEAMRMQLPPVQPQPPQRPPSVEIPVREPAFLRKPVQYPDREAVANEQASPWQRQEQPQPLIQRAPPAQQRVMIPDRPLPSQIPPPQPMVRAPVSFTRPTTVDIPGRERELASMQVEDKPLFVKIGQYREAMSHLELLKQKIKDAEATLAKLEDLRAKEQTEITNAHTTVAAIKDKLLAIDKKLFEV